MKELILNYWPIGILFVLFFVLFMIVHKKFKEKNVLASIIKKHKENTDLKILSEAEFVTRFGAIENKSLLYKMDRLILTSGIKNRVSWINGEVFLIALVGLALAGFFEGITFFSNYFVASFLATAQAWSIFFGLAKGCVHFLPKIGCLSILLCHTTIFSFWSFAQEGHQFNRINQGH